MEGFLTLYQCRDGCHAILVSWAEQTASEAIAQSTFVVTHLGAIRNRVESIDRFQAQRCEFSPMKAWLECYARLLDQEFHRPGHPDHRCWERAILRAATRVTEVELRSIPLTSPVPHAL